MPDFYKFDIDPERMGGEGHLSAEACEEMKLLVESTFLLEIDGAELTFLIDVIKHTYMNTWTAEHIRSDIGDLYNKIQAQRLEQMDVSVYGQLAEEARQHALGIHDSDLKDLFDDFEADSGD